LKRGWQQKGVEWWGVTWTEERQDRRPGPRVQCADLRELQLLEKRMSGSQATPEKEEEKAVIVII